MNGILNVYKEKGYTSHDVVAKLRGICRQKKIGHTGTLDPDAEGVLPVCLGKAAKVCGLITDKDKEYEAVLLLGKETDTQDISGKIKNEQEVLCTPQQVRETVCSFLGAQDQIPPMYSALKVNGKKLCDLAREGIEVERRARRIQIFDISILWIRLPRVKMRVHCSKGTYIRTLCHDIGRKLGCGGCMEELLRTRAGMFGLDTALKLDEIQTLAKQGGLTEKLLPPDCVFLDYPAAQAVEGFEKILENGCRLPRRALKMEQGAQSTIEGNGQMLRVYYGQEFFGIYMQDSKDGSYKPVKIFWQRK